MRDLSSSLASLNDQQLKAVTHQKGPLLVLAGAGTGKTKVITLRIAYLISQGVNPEAIVAVSFTNKAAKEMRERLALLLGPQTANRVALSTFHSFALSLLRKFHDEFSLPNNFSVASAHESQEILKEALKECCLQDILPVHVATQKIGAFKDQLFTEDDFGRQQGVFDSKILCRLFQVYNRMLRLFNRVDFDDIVYLTVCGLKKKPQLLAAIQQRISHLLIDEYQDTGNAQFELICALCSQSREVCVVGDDDQSIYSWRGAKASVMNDFFQSYPDATLVTLEQNYRCSPNILNAANSVIRENTERIGKELWSQQENQHPIVLQSCENERDEALFVAEQIEAIKRDCPHFIYHDIAVLFRSNRQVAPVEQVFLEKKIPYTLSGEKPATDRKEVKDLLACLKFAADNNDLRSLSRILNTKNRGIRVATLEEIRQLFLEKAKSSPQDRTTLLQILEKMAPTHAAIRDFLSDWKTFGLPLQQADRQGDISFLLRQCYAQLGLQKEILASSANMQEAKYRMGHVEKTLNTIERLDLKNESLQSVLDALHLDDGDLFETRRLAKNKVQMMSIHGAKGLEFDSVFILGAEDGILPHEKSLQLECGEQEERRLFYVAITRAKKRLFISRCGFRRQGLAAFTNKEPQPSRFLSSIPHHLVVLAETDPSSAEAKRMEAARKLFELFR